MNRVILLGNLGKVPEIRTTQSGKMVTSFSLGVQEGYGDKRTTSWHNVVCWEKLAESAGNYLDKGSKVLVEGKLQTRSYEGKDGQKRYVTEIVASHLEFLSKKVQPADAPADASQFGHDVHPDDCLPF